jgi:hypothetical protein
VEVELRIDFPHLEPTDERRQTMKFSVIRISKAHLESLSEDEQVLLVQLGKLLNELNISEKCLLIANANVESSPGVERTSHVTQGWFFMSMSALKLDAGRKEVLQKLYEGTQLSKKYEPRLPDETKRAVKQIRKYFNKEDNYISLIRNAVTAHYDAGKIKEQIDDLSSESSFDWILSEMGGNCLFALSRDIEFLAILNSVDASTEQEAFGMIVDDLIEVTGWFLQFAHDCICAIIADLRLAVEEEVEIVTPPSLAETRLPYFWPAPPI